MPGFVDLHMHSKYSDGSCTPAELIAMACEKGLYAVALTDHDTVEGVPEFLEAAGDTPVNVIPGVEISSVYNGKEVHILGYNIDYKSEILKDKLEHLADLRYERDEKMCELLNREGIDICMQELRARFSSRVITRAHFAIYIVEKGYCKDRKEAFGKYLADGAPCYIPRYKLPMKDTQELISDSGGICSIAHPVNYKMTDEEYMEFFRYAGSIGIGGIEAYHSNNKPGDAEKFKKMANELGMFITGGSDFHGDLKPDIEIGTGRGNLMIPGNILNKMWNI